MSAELIKEMKHYLKQYGEILDNVCDTCLNCPNEEMEEVFGDWATVHKRRRKLKSLLKEIKSER